MKVMISQPMKGRHDSDIKSERERVRKALEKMHIEVMDTFFEDAAPENDRSGVYLLSKSLMKMCEADAVIFIGNWRLARGCRLEHQVCKEYGIKILYEDFVEEPKDEILRSSSVTITSCNDGLIGSNTGITY